MLPLCTQLNEKDMKTITEEQSQLLLKHSEFILEESRRWFTPLGKKYPIYPLMLSAAIHGLQSVVNDINQ